MKKNYEEYKALDLSVDKLCDQEKFDEAIKLLEISYTLFPDYDCELKTYNLYICRAIKKYDKCIEILDECMEKGYFYGLRWSNWDPLRELPEWDEIEKRNEENRAVASAEAKMEYKVYKPEGYDKNNSYPLYLILHGDGNGCNIENFSKEWKPDTFTNKGFIVAYLQSSYPECSIGFGWTFDYEQSRNDILEGYNKVCDEYSVDMDNIHLGGFSGGAMASLNVMMNNTIPAKSIISLCPGETDDVNSQNIKKAAARGVKLLLLEGESSGEVPFHLELMELSKKSNLVSKYFIMKDAGHNIPDNWDEVLEENLDFLTK